LRLSVPRPIQRWMEDCKLWRCRIPPSFAEVLKPGAEAAGEDAVPLEAESLIAEARALRQTQHGLDLPHRRGTCPQNLGRHRADVG
jgi:hypothetical protein